MSRKTGLLVSVFLILSFGLTTIWSTVPNLFWVQSGFLLAGIVIAFLFYKLDLPLAFSLSTFIYIASVLILVLTLFFGLSVRGATRWFLGMQTSEIVKPLLAISYAGFLTNHRLNKFKNLVFYLVIIIIPVLLVKAQPDLGSSLVLLALAGFMAAFAGLGKKKILAFFLLFLALVPVAPLFLKDYQLDRIESFLNPYHDPRGKGYNAIQSVIAIGSGGLLGKGVRLGTQSHLNFLPERHTDFIFASFAEEFGLLGVILVILAYYHLLTTLSRISQTAKEDECRFLALGILAIFTFQTLVNIGMNLGLLPVTGITLPLFSYGGSSLISFMMLLGLSLKILELTPSHKI